MHDEVLGVQPLAALVVQGVVPRVGVLAMYHVHCDRLILFQIDSGRIDFDRKQVREARS